MLILLMLVGLWARVCMHPYNGAAVATDCKQTNRNKQVQPAMLCLPYCLLQAGQWCYPNTRATWRSCTSSTSSSHSPTQCFFWSSSETICVTIHRCFLAPSCIERGGGWGWQAHQSWPRPGAAWVCGRRGERLSRNQLMMCKCWVG
jgi:hypothetical protein